MHRPHKNNSYLSRESSEDRGRAVWKNDENRMIIDYLLELKEGIKYNMDLLGGIERYVKKVKPEMDVVSGLRFLVEGKAAVERKSFTEIFYGFREKEDIGDQINYLEGKEELD